MPNGLFYLLFNPLALAGAVIVLNVIAGGLFVIVCSVAARRRG